MITRRRILGLSAASTAMWLGTERLLFAKQPLSQVRGVNASQAEKISQLLSDFAQRFQVPGLSLAMAYRGQLKVVAAYGYRDLARRQMVTNETRFRIASISKPITATATMKLVEDGRLMLDHRVFATDGMLSSFRTAVLATSKVNAERLEKITVAHLLEHTAGGWANMKQDPMFDPETLEMDHKELIDFTIRNRIIDNEPGKVFAYSNFGYCLLGRIIERVTGQSYQAAVIELVLAKCGAGRMQIGQRQQSQRLDDESEYFGQGDDAYHPIMRVDRMDAHGGWVATPTELVKFGCCVDRDKHRSDALSSPIIDEMLTPRILGSGYAKGWNVNEVGHHWHMGSFNGASGVLVCTKDAYVWSLLTNTRVHSDEYASELDMLPWRVKEAIGSFDSHDLFEQ